MRGADTKKRLKITTKNSVQKRNPIGFFGFPIYGGGIDGGIIGGIGGKLSFTGLRAILVE
jgi:hypothetical protein